MVDTQERMMALVQLERHSNICKQMCSAKWLRSTKRPSSKLANRQLRIADLFSGAGGMSLGAFEAAYAHGYRPTISIAVDVNPDAMAVYKRNFKTSILQASIADINKMLPGTLGKPPRKAEAALISQIGRIDVLLAGPPCQGHSDLNNHTRRNDQRNWLYLRAVRFAELFRPQVAIIENVRSVTLDRNEVVRKGAETFEKLGYQVHEFVLNASELGLPQLRKRHVLLAVKRSIPKFEIKGKVKAPPLSSVIEDLIDEYLAAGSDVYRTPSRMSKSNIERTKYLFEKDEFDLPNELRPPCHRDRAHSYVSMYGRLHWDKPAQTITSGFGSPGQGRYIHPHRQRVITPHEAARIQGFPDYFTFRDVSSRTRLQELIGNAVPPVLAAVVLEHVILSGGLAR